MELEYLKLVFVKKYYNIFLLLIFMFFFKKNFIRFVIKLCFYMMYKYLNLFLFIFICLFVDFIEL